MYTKANKQVLSTIIYGSLRNTWDFACIWVHYLFIEMLCPPITINTQENISNPNVNLIGTSITNKW